jgi:tetratricopeptide (TPR) repeat protein
VAQLGDAALVLGNWDGAEPWLDALEARAVDEPARNAHAGALGRVAFALLASGRAARADAVLERARSQVAQLGPEGGLSAGHVENALGTRAALARRRVEALGCYRRAAAAFERVDAVRLASGATNNAGTMQVDLGAYAAAAELLGRALEMADTAGSAYASALSGFNLGLAWMHLGRLDDAIALEERSVQAFRQQGDARPAGR